MTFRNALAVGLTTAVFACPALAQTAKHIWQYPSGAPAQSNDTIVIERAPSNGVPSASTCGGSPDPCSTLTLPLTSLWQNTPIANPTITGTIGGSPYLPGYIQAITPEMYGAKGDGVTNDTTAIQNAINAAQSNAGGVNTVWLGFKTYLFTPPLNITNTVRLIGEGHNSTFLKPVAGSTANLINVGYQGNEIDGVEIRGIGFTSPSPLGGYAISSHNTGRMHVRDIGLGGGFSDAPYCGIQDARSNNNAYDDIWGYTQGSGCESFLWYGNISAGERSDQLELKNIEINNGFFGNDGLVLRGMVQTLDAQNLVFLENRHGFWVDAAGATSSSFPGFGSIYNLQVEGSMIAACEIDAGHQFYFTDGFCHSEYGETNGLSGSLLKTQGNNDNGALVINPDYTNSVTSDLKFENMGIGASATYAGVINAQGVYFANVTWESSSLKAGGTYPSVSITGESGYLSSNYSFSNNQFCGTPFNHSSSSYGLVRSQYVGTVHITGSDFSYCMTGEVQDNATSGLVAFANTDKNGNPLPNSAGVWVNNTLPGVSNCGSSPVVVGNNLIGNVATGSGSFTSCTITFASTNSSNNNGIQVLGSLLLQSTTPGVSYYTTSSTNQGFTVVRTDGGNMANEYINWRASQGTN